MFFFLHLFLFLSSTSECADFYFFFNRIANPLLILTTTILSPAPLERERSVESSRGLPSRSFPCARVLLQSYTAFRFTAIALIYAPKTKPLSCFGDYPSYLEFIFLRYLCILAPPGVSSSLIRMSASCVRFVCGDIPNGNEIRQRCKLARDKCAIDDV